MHSLVGHKKCSKCRWHLTNWTLVASNKYQYSKVFMLCTVLIAERLVQCAIYGLIFMDTDIDTTIYR